MVFDPSRWQRFESNGIPVYLFADRPEWFVPTSASDRVIQRWMSGNPVHGLMEKKLALRLPDAEATPYQGRAAVLESPQLQELWFHVTDRCNLACNHCLFASGPQQKTELCAESLLRRATQAHAMGCRVFALTGGEPLFHRNFDVILRGLLALDEARVVILTNGLLLQSCFEGQSYDLSRVFFQVSIDGLQPRHDHIRGPGSFHQLQQQLSWMRSAAIPFTVSMCVEAGNVDDMPAVVDLAADLGAQNLHFMWYFVRGRGTDHGFVPPEKLFSPLIEAQRRGEARSVVIDNIEALKTQVFAPVGTRHDGSHGGWAAAAIGPDGHLYPTAATIGLQDLATPIQDDLDQAWHQSKVLNDIRHATVASMHEPLRFILGGGDFDHSYMVAKTPLGDDPYLPLYGKLALWLIGQEAERYADKEALGLRLKMGDLLESCGSNTEVALTHSNCLLSVAHADTRQKVGDFYSAAVGDRNEEILNPVCYDEDLIRHIPLEFRFRGYGCGSPVLDAALETGETVVDLGCGSGVECFVAARHVGRGGRVIGVDMLDPMLELAARGAAGVRKNLGFDNLEFRKGFLEHLPVENDDVDCVLSNCVMNLSPNKRQAFGEILRVLKPGGRLVISDVVCETEPTAAIRNDEILQGECIGGALTQKDLVGLLQELGFEKVRLIKRFAYRTVSGHPFFSLTYEAKKPTVAVDQVRVIYRGPFAAVRTEHGGTLYCGHVETLPHSEAEALGEQIFILDDAGNVTNVEAENACCCTPEAFDRGDPVAQAKPADQGCLVCGEPLIYGTRQQTVQCAYCDGSFTTATTCAQGHFICDSCHSGDAVTVIEQSLLQTDETDMLALFRQIRQHPCFKTHGPEHHALVPGIVLAAYRNSGGSLDPQILRTGIERGARIAGGSCAYTGVCGAASGVGIAFSLLLEANPVRGKERQAVQGVVGHIVQALAGFEAARCCLRDCTVALQEAARLSQDLLDIPLKAEEVTTCHQQAKNEECFGSGCPLASAADD